jgi:hypothetical protein
MIIVLMSTKHFSAGTESMFLASAPPITVVKTEIMAKVKALTTSFPALGPAFLSM